MPAASSTIRSVPGGKADPLGAGSAVGPVPSAEPLGRPTRKPMRTTSTSPSADSATTHPVRLGERPGPGGGVGAAASGAGAGAAAGACTATPGPTGVVTSDHPPPFHQRAVPGAPSGSGYHPGGALDVPVTAPTLGAQAGSPGQRRSAT